MNKTELSQRVAEACDLSDAAGARAVDAVFEIIKQALASGDKVAIAKFGTFAARCRPARQGRNPKTGETIAIAASVSAGFKAASGLKDALAPQKPGA